MAYHRIEAVIDADDTEMLRNHTVVGLDIGSRGTKARQHLLYHGYQRRFQ